MASYFPREQATAATAATFDGETTHLTADRLGTAAQYTLDLETGIATFIRAIPRSVTGMTAKLPIPAAEYARAETTTLTLTPGQLFQFRNHEKTYTCLTVDDVGLQRQVVTFSPAAWEAIPIDTDILLNDALAPVVRFDKAAPGYRRAVDGWHTADLRFVEDATPVTEPSAADG